MGHHLQCVDIDQVQRVPGGRQGRAPQPGTYAEVETYIRKSGGKIIERKGATFYAVAISVCHICKCIFRAWTPAMTVSSMMHGEYGLDDVCLSTLAIVGAGGLAGKLVTP